MRDFGGFDHNKHSLRLVTELEQRYPEFPGLNLTWEVREGIVKHESEYDISDAATFSPDLRGNLETQICNVADELAYTAHDLDDGLRSGMITPRMLNGIMLWEHLSGSISWQGSELLDVDRHRIIRKLIGLEVTDLVNATDRTHQRQRRKITIGYPKTESQCDWLQRRDPSPQPRTKGFPVHPHVPPPSRRADAGQG